MPPHNVSVPFANLLGLALGGLVQGVYLVLFIGSMYLSIYSNVGRRSKPIGRIPSALKSPIVIASLALFTTATATWILTVYRNFQGWILFQGGSDPELFFTTSSITSETVANATTALSFVIGDAMLIYRLWAVWRNRWVLAPALLCFLGLITALVITIIQTPHINGSAISEDIGLTPITVFALCTTLYCTALISYKIYKVGSAVSGLVGEKSLTHIAIIFAESAAAYTSWALLYAILHWVNLNLQFSIFCTLPSMLGAANALINARVALGRAVDSTSHWSNTNSNSNARSGASANLPVHVPIRFARQQSDTVLGTRTTDAGDAEAQDYAMDSVSKGDA
ncbi:hypothetical protein C8F01DRAFT_1370390 [Mycena amicta]|nr:hypothetical protein C8F01DRAFT_1370390 [Mycena amicta]